ncbi:MAG TPA: PQQ-binding-like beta-propeller repeat protein [Micromonosporaceae bacterium]
MRPARVLWLTVAVLVLVALVGVIGYRTFVPREILTRPTGAIPAEDVLITDERPFSELRAAPLVVDGRLRVYAEKRRVWADAPVGGRYEATPYWALRRWPGQVVGLAVAHAGPDAAVVVSQWTDGQLIAVDALRGSVAWRIEVPVSQTGYPGRRTGANVVYEPRSLLTAPAGDRDVLIVTSPGRIRAVDPADGGTIWQRDWPGGCEPRPWTGSGLLVVPDCAGGRLTFIRARDGRDRDTWSAPAGTAPAPGLCELGRAGCRVVLAGGQVWQLEPSAALTPLPPLEAGAIPAGRRVVYPTATGVAARSLADREPVWTWQGKGTLVHADGTWVYLLTADRTVIGLSTVTGHLDVLGCASSVPNEEWRVGHVYSTGNYLALERIKKAPAGADDARYFYGPRPVALVELYPPTKLPVWPGKFAACRPMQ